MREAFPLVPIAALLVATLPPTPTPADTTAPADALAIERQLEAMEREADATARENRERSRHTGGPVLTDYTQQITRTPEEGLRHGLAEREARFDQQRQEAAEAADATGEGNAAAWLAVPALLLVLGLFGWAAAVAIAREPAQRRNEHRPADPGDVHRTTVPAPAPRAASGNVATPSTGDQLFSSRREERSQADRPPIIDTDPGNNARAAVKVLALFIAAGSLGTAAVIGIIGPMIGFAAAWALASWADRQWPKNASILNYGIYSI